MFKKLASATAALLVALTPLMSTATAFAATSGPNLISNPGVETDTTGWVNNGDVNAVYTHATEGYNSSKSLKVEYATYTTGTADWYHSPITVTAGSAYTYSQWFKSTTASSLDVEMYDAAGVVVAGSNVSIATAAASPTAWTQITASFTVPANVSSMVFYQVLSSAGSLQIDNAELYAGTATTTPGTGTTFARPMVSVSFDDGWTNQYTNGKQVLLDNGINATFYLMSDAIKGVYGDSYMTSAQAQALLADGHEIASHTIDHCSMTGVTKGAACPDPTTMTNEAANAFIQNQMLQSKTDIEASISGAKVTNFAYPYGEYNDASTAIGKGIYTSLRTVECGQNAKATLDLSKLKGCDIGATAPGSTSSVVDYAKGLIDNAITQKTWVVLFFHEIANAGQGVPGDEAYTTSVADYTAIMQYINSRKADIDNMSVAKAITAATATTPTTKPGDLTGTDGKIDEADLFVMFNNWSKPGATATATAAQGDLTGPTGQPDGLIDEADLFVMFTNWSK